MLFFLKISLNVFSTPANPAMKYKHLEKHKLASEDAKF